MKNICYNCNYCNDIEVDMYYCTYEYESSIDIVLINHNREMCIVGIEDLAKNSDDD